MLVALFVNIFSHPVGSLFILFMISFGVQKPLSFIRSHLFIFGFVSITLGDGSKNILLWFMWKNVLPMFSSKSFTIFGITFGCLIHVLGLEDSILSKWLCHPRQSTDSMKFLSNQQFFTELEQKKKLNLCGGPKDPEWPKQSWEREMKLEESGSLTSNYTTRL